MTRQTITVKVLERGEDSQDEWQCQFDDFCRSLIRSGAARRAAVNVVFPGTSNPSMATLFTIDLEPAAEGIEKPLRRLQAMPGVQYAHAAPLRRPLAATARLKSA